MENLEEIDVITFGPEMLFEEVVDCGLEHERIVDSDVPDASLQ